MYFGCCVEGFGVFGLWVQGLGLFVVFKVIKNHKASFQGSTGFPDGSPGSLSAPFYGTFKREYQAKGNHKRCI